MKTTVVVLSAVLAVSAATMADPAYRTPDTLVSDYGPTWLWRWMKSLGMNVSFAADPDVPAWVTELFKR